MHYLYTKVSTACTDSIPLYTPKDAVTASEKIMSSEEVGWQCIVCNVLLLTIQSVEIYIEAF